MSPFGIYLRPVGDWDYGILFRSWKYNPDYLRNGNSMFISESSKNLNEPMIFITPVGKRQDKRVSNVNHPKGFKEITAASMHVPIIEDISEALKFVSGLENMSIEKSISHSLEISKDGQREGKSKKFQPSLPLFIKW